MDSASEGAAVFSAIEFRRYTIRPGERDHFARYFDAFFPEAIQQSGGIAAGTFLEERKPDRFTWLRGFRCMDDRAKANTALYHGPVWKEHRSTMNGLMLDSDDVLLLRPFAPSDRLEILPSVDPVKEKTAKGIVIAQIFSIKPDSMELFAELGRPIFAEYGSVGVHPVGLLVTLDAPNNFPQLPIRTDGTFLVWFAVAKDEEMLRKFEARVEETRSALRETGLLVGDPELVVMQPTVRSRLRWLPEWD
jgi:hypothetical protein